MAAYKSPNGHLILGTSDVVVCRAEIIGITDDGEPEYAGETEVFWDEQKTQERDGKMLFLCEQGEEWTFDQLIKIEDEAEFERERECQFWLAQVQGTLPLIVDYPGVKPIDESFEPIQGEG